MQWLFYPSEKKFSQWRFLLPSSPTLGLLQDSTLNSSSFVWPKCLSSQRWRQTQKNKPEVWLQVLMITLRVYSGTDPHTDLYLYFSNAEVREQLLSRVRKIPTERKLPETDASSVYHQCLDGEQVSLFFLFCRSQDPLSWAACYGSYTNMAAIRVFHFLYERFAWLCVIHRCIGMKWMIVRINKVVESVLLIELFRIWHYDSDLQQIV